MITEAAAGRSAAESYVLDTSAWVEYFQNSPLADKAAAFINNCPCFTPTIVVAELQATFLRDGADFSKAFRFIEAKTPVLSLNKKIALAAGKLRFERKKINQKWGMSDAIVLATAREIGAKVITGDEDFRFLKAEVVMLT